MALLSSPSVHWARLPARVPYLGYFWRLFTSVRFALILILIQAVGFFLGVVISQVPQEIAFNPQDYAGWVESQARPRYGVFTNLFFLLGLFDVFHAVWFRASLALLFVAIIICTTNRFPAIYQSTIKAKPTVNEGFLRTSKHRAHFRLAGDLESLVAALRQRRFAVTLTQGQDRTHLYADKYAWAKYATFVSHLGLILFLTAGFLTNVFGYQRFLIIPDDHSQPIYPVFHAEQMQVLNEGFTVEYYEDGRPKDYYSNLVIYKDGKEAARGQIRVNQPMDFGDFRFHQNSFGPTVKVDIATTGGQRLFSENMVLGQAFGNVPFDLVAIPTTEINAVVALVEGNTTTDIRGGTFIRGGQEASLAVMGFSGNTMGQPAFTMRLRPGETQEREGLRVTFQGTGFFSGVVARKDPGATFVWLGAALFVPAVWTTFWCARRRLWLQVIGHEVRMAGMADRFVDLGREIDELVSAIGRPVASGDDSADNTLVGKERSLVLSEAAG